MSQEVNREIWWKMETEEGESQIEVSVETKFCEYCATGNLEEVVNLYQENQSLLQCVDPSGFSPLHWACLKDHATVVSWILSKGANINFKGPTGANPIHWAAQSGAIHCLPVLFNYVLETSNNDDQMIQKSAFCAEDSFGLQPIHYCAKGGDLLFLHYLVCIGCDINAIDHEKHTPLHWATKNAQMEASLYLLNQDGCNKNALDNTSNTPLHWAAAVGHLPTVQMLTNFEVNLRIQNSLGQTAKECAEFIPDRKAFRHLRDLEESGYDFANPKIDHNQPLRVFVFLLPLILQSILYYTLCNYSILSIQTFTFLPATFLLYYYTKHLYFPAHSNSPFAYGIVIAALLFLWGTAYTKLFPHILYQYY